MILTVCNRGNVRSVTVAQILKDLFALKDVIAVGLDTTTDEFLYAMTAQAETVLIAGTTFRPFPLEGRKIKTLNIGDDVWGKPGYPDLVERIIPELLAIGFSPSSVYYPTVISYIAAVRQSWGMS